MANTLVSDYHDLKIHDVLWCSQWHSPKYHGQYSTRTEGTYPEHTAIKYQLGNHVVKMGPPAVIRHDSFGTNNGPWANILPRTHTTTLTSMITRNTSFPAYDFAYPFKNQSSSAKNKNNWVQYKYKFISQQQISMNECCTGWNNCFHNFGHVNSLIDWKSDPLVDGLIGDCPYQYKTWYEWTIPVYLAL